MGVCGRGERGGHRGDGAGCAYWLSTNSDAGDLCVDELGKIGSDEIGWTDSSLVKPGEWYRLSMCVSLGDTLINVGVALDGDSILVKASLANLAVELYG